MVLYHIDWRACHHSVCSDCCCVLRLHTARTNLHGHVSAGDHNNSSFCFVCPYSTPGFSQTADDDGVWSTNNSSCYTEALISSGVHYFSSGETSYSVPEMGLYKYHHSTKLYWKISPILLLLLAVLLQVHSVSSSDKGNKQVIPFVVQLCAMVIMSLANTSPIHCTCTFM